MLLEKNFVKKALAIVLCAIIMMSTCCISASSASVYARPDKHIYLVMDDSGSMEDYGREMDANYSLQTLLAMTDKTDTVDLYFLNSNSSKIGKIDLTNKSNKMLEKVRVNYPDAKGSTPYDAVHKAQQDLKSSVKDNSDDEYWLIVVTDGRFDSSSIDYESDIVTFSKTQLKNGTYPNVLCVSINSYSFVSASKISENLKTLENSDVKTSMNEAAKIISDRIEISKYNLSSDGKNISFNTPYPAKNIIIFSQETKTKITNHSSNANLNTDETYEVVHPNTNKSSSVCFVTEKSGGSIPSGPISFNFSSKLDPNNTVILVEPAIALAAHFYNQDGTECDPQDLRIGESAKLIFTICDPATNQPINEAVIDGGVTYSADINGTTYNDNEIEFTVDSEDLTIDMFAEFTDGFTLDIHKEYSGLEQITLVSMVVSNGGNFSEDLYSLDDSSYITATPYVNGSQFTADQISKSNLRIKGDNFFTSRFVIEPDPASGLFRIYPKGGIFKVFTPFTTELEVTLEPIAGDPVTERVTVELTGPRRWIPFILAIVGILILIYLIVVYSYKKKFPLDLRLYIYIANPKGKIDLTATECRPKTIFHPGVINFVSALPHPGPFKINLSAVSKSYGNIKLVANTDMAFVQGVSTIDVPNKRNPRIVTQEPEYKTSRSQTGPWMGFAPSDTTNDLNEKKKEKLGQILIIRDEDFMLQQNYSRRNPKYLLRYIRKSTLKANGEI